ncbi:HotDog domain-containing protein [Mycena amicta]|nr:HotDog domain-containing protein [Mycena amicta]
MQLQVSSAIPPDLRAAILDLRTLYGAEPLPLGFGFGDLISARLLVTEASVDEDKETGRVSGRLVVEVEVADDMLNSLGNVHGGCSALLVDIGSTLCIMACYRGPHISQSLNIVYHSPAALGDKLRIVSTTIAIGTRVISARTEIWNATRKRLTASAVHVKMRPSAPPKL